MWVRVFEKSEKGTPQSAFTLLLNLIIHHTTILTLVECPCGQTSGPLDLDGYFLTASAYTIGATPAVTPMIRASACAVMYYILLLSDVEEPRQT